MAVKLNTGLLLKNRVRSVRRFVWLIGLCAVTPAYSDIGNTGPGGGIIFYETEDGLHGLEAAPSDLDGKFPWGCIGVNLADVDDVSFDSTDSQSGEYNTPIIAEACGPDSAAGAANDFSFAGVDDWFLPNKAELDLMWRAIGSGCTFSSEAKAVSGCIDVAQLSGGWYWCSSESNSEKVWNQEMRGGGVDRSARNIKLRVRPIRAF